MCVPVAAYEDSSVCSRRPRAAGVEYPQWGTVHERSSAHTADSQTPPADCSQMTRATQCAWGLPKHKDRHFLTPKHIHLLLLPLVCSTVC